MFDADPDADPDLLGVRNGILDLKTRQLQQITPEVIVSKRISVSFELTAQYRMWMCCLSDIQPENAQSEKQ